MSGRARITLESRESELARLGESIEQFGAEQDWSPKLLFQLQLALEEIALNVINHGYGEAGHHLEIDLESTPESITVEVSDSARPYNPLVETPAPELDAEVEDRTIGGLGVHIVRTISDQISYVREGGKNRLKFVKWRDS